MEAEPCSDEKTETTFSSFSKSRRWSGLHTCTPLSLDLSFLINKMRVLVSSTSRIQ